MQQRSDATIPLLRPHSRSNGLPALPQLCQELCVAFLQESSTITLTAISSCVAFLQAIRQICPCVLTGHLAPKMTGQ